MKVTNMNQLEKLLNQRLNKAMSIAANRCLEILYDETGSFYVGGEPEIYERTGALGDTPAVTPILNNSKTISFEAYLNTNYTYNSGKNPTMLDVLRLANSGIIDSSVGKLFNTVGSEGFWDRAVVRMEKEFYKTLEEFFK